MDNVLDRYYKVNSYLFLVLGLRLTSTSRIYQTQSILVFLLLCSGVVSQVLTMIMSDLNKAALFTKSSPLIINMIFVVKQGMLMHKRNEICYIFNRIKCDWTTIQDKLERQIMTEFAISARTHIFLFLAVTLPPGVLTSMSMFVPWMLNLVSPVNQTRSSILNIDVSYVFDQQQYHTFYVVFIGLIIIIGTIVLNAFEALLMVTMQHASSLFRVTSYRLEQALSEVPLNVVPEKGSRFGDQGTLNSAINLHARVLEFVDFLRANFMLSYALLLILGTISLSAGLYCMSQVRLRVEDIEEIITSVTLVITHFGYSFYCHHVLQLTTEESESVFYNAGHCGNAFAPYTGIRFMMGNSYMGSRYHTNWYNTSVSIQKQLRFIIHRSFDGFAFDLWTVYRPSLEGFTAFVKTAFSYFMIIRSIQ